MSNTTTCTVPYCTRADQLLDIETMHVLKIQNNDSTGFKIWIETDRSLVGCPSCGVICVGHGRRNVKLRDIPINGKPVYLLWVKRLWRCPERKCRVKVFSETHPIAPPRAKLTTRAVAWAANALEKYDTSVSALATQLGVSWNTVWNPVKSYATKTINDPARLQGIDAIGVDEHVYTHVGFVSSRMVTGIIDHTRDNTGKTKARLLDLVPGRSGKVYADWLGRQTPEFRAGIKTATLDPFRGYANAISQQLPEAIRVLDAFHVVKLGIDMVDDVRRRVQQQRLGHRGRRGDPLYGIRRTLLQGVELLSDKQWDRLIAKLEAGDVGDQVFLAWQCYQQLRSIYYCDYKKGPRLVDEIVDSFTTCPVPEIARLGKTLRSWKSAIKAYYHTQGASNGPTESVNGVIETTRRIARGFRNFTNYRIRCLLAASGNRPYRTKVKQYPLKQ